MGKKKRLMYRGPSRDIKYNPWLRLTHGVRYDIEIHKMRSGKIRVTVTDGYERARISYNTKDEFDKEWCK